MKTYRYDLDNSSISLLRSKFNICVRSIESDVPLKEGQEILLENREGTPHFKIEEIIPHYDLPYEISITPLDGGVIPVFAYTQNVEVEHGDSYTY